MAPERLQAPRGTFDVLPREGRRRLRLAELAGELLGRAGYEPFESPVFEDTELFARGVGEATDIVQKEMFTFEDKAGRSLTLRPEGTAGICRAYVEHGMHKLAQPVKLWYWGAFFRHEAPQAGRFRQFTQIGAEALGSDDPSLDAELILLLADLLERAGAGDLRVRLSSLGTPATRASYADELRAYLRERESELSPEVLERLDSNPLRAFDSDHPGTRRAMAGAPRLLDRLDAADAEHFEQVRKLLDGSRLAYEIDPTLVRGLDYYTRTVFEIESGRLGAQSALGGGGRYDLLVEELRAHLRAHEGDLSEEVRARIDQNPLRAFDADHPGTQSVMQSAPRLLDRLAPADAEHFAEVRALLDDAGLAYELDPTLVRGLDYYTRTVFEFESDRLGAQRGLGGGGRYDLLVEQLGGPPTPGVGWAAGVERILLAQDERPRGAHSPARAYVAVAKPDLRQEAFRVVRALRAAGADADMEQAGRSLKGQLKHADRWNATHVVIVGDELEVKDMDSGEQQAVPDVDEAVRVVVE